MKLRSQGKAIPSTPPYHPAWLSCVPATPVKKRIAVVRIERRDVVLFSTVFSHGPGEARILVHGGDKIPYILYLSPIRVSIRYGLPVLETSCAEKIAPKTIPSIMGVRKLPLTHGNKTWTPRRRVPFARNHRPLAAAGGLLRTLAAAGVSPAPGLTAVPGTPVAVATAREGVEGTRRRGCRCHLPERPGRGGLCAGDLPGVADTDRQCAGDVSGLRHEPGTLVEHFRTAELVGLCKTAVTGAASPDAEWRCQPTGRRRNRRPGRGSFGCTTSATGQGTDRQSTHCSIPCGGADDVSCSSASEPPRQGSVGRECPPENGAARM